MSLIGFMQNSLALAPPPRERHPACGRCLARRAAAVGAAVPGALGGVVAEVAPGIYTFPAFNEDFCRRLLAEVSRFYATGLRSLRPNSMNRHGAVLEELGLGPAVASLQREVLVPLARALFPGIGDELDGHHAFVVHYRPGPGGDRELPPHRDDSEVTFNAALGPGGWRGSDLLFCGRMQEPDVHRLQLRHTFEVGSAVLHVGRHVHTADPILGGERTNLVVWSRSWHWRSRGGDGQLGARPPRGRPDGRCLRAASAAGAGGG